MLTLLYIIHQWFFTSSNSSKPKPCSKRSTEHSDSKPLPSHIHSSKLISEVTSQHSNISTKIFVLNITHLSLPLSHPGEVCAFKTMSVEEKFKAAVRVIHSLPKDGPFQPSNSTKLKFYGLYKQATDGRNTSSKPGFWDVVGRAKWEAWNKFGSMSKDDAMSQYVDNLKEIVETMSFNGEVENFLDSIGPFYEFVNLQGNEMNHIKEKLDEVTSSSGSSLANSAAPSAENSKENSPTKTHVNGHDDEEEEEASSSDKAEVIVETSTATYESKASKNYSSQNGNAFKMETRDYNEKLITPPTPLHSYSHQNGFVKHALSNDEDEVLAVSSTSAYCKEDLEHDIHDSNGTDHDKVKVSMTASVETVASNATSGTESEKYYSGDSEPEVDEKYSFLANEYRPSTSVAAQMQLIDNGTLKKSNSSSPLLKKSKERNGPKPNVTTFRSGNTDVVLHQTVDRINRDVDHILARLRILEAAYAANADGAIRNPQNQERKRIFGNLSTQSIAFIVMWPFVCQFLIKLIRWWWQRRRNATIRSITNS